VSEQAVRKRGRRRNTRLGILIAVGAVIAVVLLAILIDSALYYNKVHAGVSVAGQDLGGMTRDEASAVLTALVEDAQSNAVNLVSDEKTWPVMPADVGTEFDIDGAVTEAMEVSREDDFFTDLGRRLKLYFSRVDIPLQGSVDSAKIDALLAGIAEELDVPPVNAGLAIEGTEIKVIEGKNGQVVDQESLAADLAAVLVSLHSTDLEIPIVVKEPAVKAEDNQQALETARTMLSGPIKLVRGDDSWTLSVEEIAKYMDFTSEMDNGVSTLVPIFTASKMTPFFEALAPQVAKAPVDASFDSNGERAWVVPAVLGEALDEAKTAEAITAAALKTGAGRTVEVAVKTTEPELTTEEAEAMGIKDKLASYTTEYVGSANRQVNVRITTEYASNVMLAPGEIYNFDKQIGPRTAARGYKTAPGIVGPGKLEDVFGGGICQVSTTLFNAAFFAGLEIVERRNHSIYIAHYPKGRDATVSAGSPNLRFKNDMSHYIWIRGISNGIKTTFTIYGTSEGRTVKYTTSDFYNVKPRTEVTIANPLLAEGKTNVLIDGQSGKQCKVVRTIYLPDGSVYRTDTFISTWPMIPRQIEVGTSSTTTTTAGPSTTSTTAATTTTTESTTTTTEGG
jgi:vancomycin resistance protein YoaR